MDLSWILAGFVAYLVLHEIRLLITTIGKIKKNSPKHRFRRVKK